MVYDWGLEFRVCVLGCRAQGKELYKKGLRVLSPRMEKQTEQQVEHDMGTEGF